MSKRVVILSVIILILIAGGVALKLSQKHPNFSLSVSPTVALVRLDGNKTIHPGSLYITPGKHTVTASFNGFATKTVSFTTNTGLVRSVSILLVPNSQEGYNWLLGHPDEQAERQTLGGSAFNQSVQQSLRQNPIISKLPFMGPGNEYRIDYGTTPEKSSSTDIAIYITYYVPAGKQDALNWIEQQGYDPSKMNIVYTDQTSQQQPIDNPYTN